MSLDIPDGHVEGVRVVAPIESLVEQPMTVLALQRFLEKPGITAVELGHSHDEVAARTLLAGIAVRDEYCPSDGVPVAREKPRTIEPDVSVVRALRLCAAESWNAS